MTHSFQLLNNGSSIQVTLQKALQNMIVYSHIFGLRLLHQKIMNLLRSQGFAIGIKALYFTLRDLFLINESEPTLCM